MTQDIEKVPLYFVYPRVYKDSGSTWMRVHQTHEMIRDHLNHAFQALTVPVSNLRFKLMWRLWEHQFAPNSLIIFCKYAIDRVPKQTIDNLKKKRATIALDYIDRDMSKIYSFVDLHIASSNRQALFLKSCGIASDKVVFWEHAADYRIEKFKIYCESNNEKTFYLGEIYNAYIPSYILNKVDIINYRDSVTLDDLKNMSNYKFQYCIRPRIQNQNLSVIKPLTKIMNSIALSVPPIISRDMDEAVSILGPDYPFIVDTTVDSDFHRVFELMKSSRQAYKFAQNTLKNLQDVRSVENKILQFHDAFAHR